MQIFCSCLALDQTTSVSSRRADSRGPLPLYCRSSGMLQICDRDPLRCDRRAYSARVYQRFWTCVAAVLTEPGTEILASPVLCFGGGDRGINWQQSQGAQVR